MNLLHTLIPLQFNLATSGEFIHHYLTSGGNPPIKYCSQIITYQFKQYYEIIIVGKSGQGKFCERLNLPDCVRLSMERKEGNTEGGIPEKGQERLGWEQHM